jgi:hypothetical protein
MAKVEMEVEKVYWGALDECLELKVALQAVVVEVGDVKCLKNSYYCLLLVVVRLRYGLG